MIILKDLVTSSLLSSFCPFLTNKKQESGFQQVCGLVTRNISVFCLSRVALYFKAIPNSINFYKGIFLHVCLYYSSKDKSKSNLECLEGLLSCVYVNA